jgi:hypothetical protein
MLAFGLSGCGDDEQGTSKSFDDQLLITDVFSDFTVDLELGRFTVDMEFEVPADSYVRFDLLNPGKAENKENQWEGYYFLENVLEETGLLSNKTDKAYNVRIKYEEQISFISSDEVQLNYSVSGENGLRESKMLIGEINPNQYIPLIVLYIYDHDATSSTDYIERKTYRIGNPHVKISDYYIHDTTISTEDVK